MIIDLIKRYTPKIADFFAFADIQSENGHNVFEIYSENDKIILAGDCFISKAMAYYRYLTEYCSVCFTHCGGYDIEITSAPLPDKKIRKVILQDKRIAYTPGVQSYSGAFWDWNRWVREIDFMAMRGINMPYISLGLQYVYYSCYRECGLNESNALKSIAGPCFFHEQLKGNFTGYMPPMSEDYIEHTRILGKKIFDLEKSYGMTPIFQGYWGHVSDKYVYAHNGTKVKYGDSWFGFSKAIYIPPKSKDFSNFGKMFLNKQAETFGSGKYFAFNMFCDTDMPSFYNSGFKHTIEKIKTLFSDINKDYILVIPAQIYGSIKDYIPSEHILVVDTDGSDFHNTSYGNAPFVIANDFQHHGDRTVLEGDLSALAGFDYEETQNKYPNLCGLFVSSEGYNQNPMYFNLCFDMLTEKNSVDLDAYIESYSRKRWDNVEIGKILAETCYTENKHHGSALCARPTTELEHTAPYDTLDINYDNKKLAKAAKMLLSKERKDDGYKYDTCDILRQVLSNLSLELVRKTITAYKEEDSEAFEEYSNKFLDLMDDMDRFLMTNPYFSLKDKADEARSLAQSDEEKNLYEINLLTQISVWGHIDRAQLYDYAWKEWGGIMESLYSARWRKYFEYMAATFYEQERLPKRTKKQVLGRNSYSDGPYFSNTAKYERGWISNEGAEATNDEDTFDVAKELLEKYSADLDIDI